MFRPTDSRSIINQREVTVDTRSFAQARSVGVQRAIAEVFIRSDPKAIAKPQLVGLLRQHRLRAPDGRQDLIVRARRVRKMLAEQYAHESRVPDVQVMRFHRDGDRSLELRHFAHRGRPLTEAASEVVKHLRRLWGFGVRLETWDGEERVGDVVECPA